MRTAAALSTTSLVGTGLADHEQIPFQPESPIPTSDAVNLAFDIAAGRRRGEEPDPQDARRVGAVRRVALAYLDLWDLAWTADAVALVASELVTNAILHGGGTRVSFTMRLQDNAVHVSVGSGKASGQVPVVRAVGGEAEHGRGLQLVEWTALASGGNWGVSDDGATTWCSLPTAGAGA